MPDEVRDLMREKAELEVENLRNEVEKKRHEKAMLKAAREDNEKAFAAKKQKDLQLFGQCNHKKGGRDYAGLQKRGDGDNYSIFSWMHPLGHMMCICTRCNFVWEPKVTDKHLSDGKTPNPTRISWEDALRLPTDNAPGGSVVFGIKPGAIPPTQAA